MSKTLESAAELNAALSSLLDGREIPDQVSASWVSEVFGITQRTVRASIASGKLPAREIKSVDGTVMAWSISPGDALLIWGHRLLKPNKEA